MKRLLVLTMVLLGFTSCGRLLEPLYIYLPGTNWYYEQDGKHAFVNFSDDGKATVLQKAIATGSVMENNGTYTADGHNVDIFGADGTTFNLTRTFSHMKNSKNKNMTRFFPQSYENLAGMVWAGVDMADLYVYYFKDGENLVRSAFTVTQYEEGVPYGWTSETIPYKLNGTTFTAGGKTGWLYSEVMLVDGRWHVYYPAPEGGSGSSVLAGTVWFYKGGTSTTAGLLVFDSGYSFTRIQVASSRTQFLMNRGTYTQEGDVLKMKLDGLTDVCTISGNTFRFMERLYERLN
ncbi:MAG: hypothetical protein IK008_00045 [Bacteroidales bacterium]|nr:hypothetical protein [Bacteroidales bacterium]